MEVQVYEAIIANKDYAGTKAVQMLLDCDKEAVVVKVVKVTIVNQDD